MTSSVNGTNSASGSSAGSDSVGVNLTDVSQLQNNFITLMVAQIQYQDPTDPVDSTQFVNQYSQLSQVQSLENLNTIQKNSLVLADNLQNLTAAGLVGQKVMVSVDSLQLDDAVVDGQVQLEHASTSTTLKLTSAATGEVTKLALGPQEAGSVAFSVDPQKLGLAPGKYGVEVETSSGEKPKVELGGKVSHVRVSDSGPVLEVEGAGSVPFYNIVEFGSAAA